MKLTGGLDELAHRRALKRWSRIASEADTLNATSLRALRGQACALRGTLDTVIEMADRRDQGAGRRIPWPDGDWVWRPRIWDMPQKPGAQIAPESGAPLGADLKLFHDCTAPSMILRQRDTAGQQPTVMLEVFDFDGSFLSVVLDLPDAGTDRLARHHTLRVALLATGERPFELIGRLNLRHGPNTSTMTASAEPVGEVLVLEFDLAYGDLTDQRVDAAWIDLIVNRPAMNAIEIADLIVSRLSRAEI